MAGNPGRRRLSGVLAAIAVTASVVAGTSRPAAAQGSINGYPKVNVVDLKTGKKVDLASNNGGKLPTLAWFWAPH
jgi:outer membrane protease